MEFKLLEKKLMSMIMMDVKHLPIMRRVVMRSLWTLRIMDFCGYLLNQKMKRMIEKLLLLTMKMKMKVVLENGDIYDPPIALALENPVTEINQLRIVGRP